MLLASMAAQPSSLQNKEGINREALAFFSFFVSFHSVSSFNFFSTRDYLATAGNKGCN
jgi:hypothetical protein